MTVCIVGSGAREHTLAYACARSTDVVVTPGNPGMASSSQFGCRITTTNDPPEEIAAKLFVIGPEAPLVDGLADRLRAKGRRVFGPSSDGARLEGSKVFMKELALAAGVPTARAAVVEHIEEAKVFLSTLEPPYVVKTDGLAAGKGVLVTSDIDEALSDVTAKLSGESFGTAGRRLVIEEGLVGSEVSLLVVCDGSCLVNLPPARDYKRVDDGDRGPNTGGMGAFSSLEVASKETVGQIMDTIVSPTVAELRRRGIDYRGVLYAGCMVTADGPKLIEYNVRFGDPETEVVLARLGGDIVEFLASAADGHLCSSPTLAPLDAACVVLAAEGYPNAPRLGDPITGVEAADALEGVTVFHGGSRLGAGGCLETAGGRVLTVTAVGPDLDVARRRAYGAIEHISFPGMHYRRDVGERSAHNGWVAEPLPDVGNTFGAVHAQ